MADYIPTADNDLLSFANNFSGNLETINESVGLVNADLLPLSAKLLAFQNLLLAHNNAQGAARSARQDKDSARTELVAVIRGLTKRIQAHPSLTDANRASLGITIADSVPSYVPAPSTRPTIAVDTSQRLKHTLNFSDEATPLSRAKPYGAMGMEIYRKIGGAAPVGVQEMQFVALDTATPYTADYDATDAGKTIYYQGCWVNRSGERSPFSQIVQATLVG